MLQLWVEKAFSNDSVTVLKGKVSWKLGAMEYYKVTAHNKPQTGDLLGGKNSEDGCLCSDLQPSVECGASCSAGEPKVKFGACVCLVLWDWEVRVLLF